MSKIDVSELLSDPDFVDEIIQLKRAPIVNSKGENKLSEVKVKTIGCVQPASGRTIFRLPEAFRVANVSEFFMKGTITATAQGKYSDVLVFKGVRYNVQMVFDWTNWGLGYCEGTCISEVPA
jgi:hypothetical protein